MFASPKGPTGSLDSNGMLMTPEEFDAATDFDERSSYELIHGVLIVSPPPGESERDPNDELGFHLRALQIRVTGPAQLSTRLFRSSTSAYADGRQTGRPRDLGRTGPNPGYENRYADDRGRVCLEAAT